MMRNSRVGRVLGAVVAFAVLAAACGDDDDDSAETSAPETTATESAAATTEAPTTENEDSATESTAAPTTESAGTTDAQTDDTAAAEPTGEPILLYSISDLTGPLALDEAEDGLLAAAKEINDAGGINGRPLEIVVCDGESNPNSTAACGQQAVESGAIAVVGAASGLGDQYMGPLIEAGIPSIGNAARSLPELTSELSFPISGGTAMALVGSAAALGNSGVERISFAFPDTGNAAQLGAVFGQQGLANFTGELTGETLIPQDAADITSFVQTSLENDTDGVLLVMAPDSINKYLVALQSLGATPTVASSTLVYSQDNFEIVGEAAEGMIITGQALPATSTDDEGVQQFLAAMDAIDSDRARSEIAMNSWATVHVVSELMRDLETIDTASLIDAMNNAGEITFGPMAPFNWSEPLTQFAPATRIFGDQIVVARVEDGEIVAETGEFITVP